MACAPGELIVAQGNWVTSWSLAKHVINWSTQTERPINLLLSHSSTGNGETRLDCRELVIRDGIVTVPTGREKGIAVALESGTVVSAAGPKNSAPRAAKRR